MKLDIRFKNLKLIKNKSISTERHTFDCLFVQFYVKRFESVQYRNYISIMKEERHISFLYKMFIWGKSPVRRSFADKLDPPVQKDEKIINITIYISEINDVFENKMKSLKKVRVTRFFKNKFGLIYEGIVCVSNPIFSDTLE